MTDLLPHPAPATRSRRAWSAVLVIGAAYLAIALARSWSLRYSVWAEDGTIHLQDRLDRGTRSVLHAYGGYLHLIPRLLVLAWPSSQLGRWPAYFVASSAVVWAMIATIVFGSCAQLLRTARVGGRTRVIVAALAGASVVLCPPASVESIGNIANLQFPLLGALGVLLAARWASTRAVLAASGFVLAVALSTPLAAFLVPAALLRARDEHRTPVGDRWLVSRQAVVGVAVIGVGEVVQVLAFLLQSRVRQVPAVGTGFVASARYAASFFSPSSVPVGGVEGLVLLCLVVTLILLASRWRERSEAEQAAAYLFASAACLYVGSYVLAGAMTPRYLIGPTVLVVTGLCVIGAARPTGGAGLAWWATTAVVGLLFATSAWSRFVPDSYRRSGGHLAGRDRRGRRRLRGRRVGGVARRRADDPRDAGLGRRARAVQRRRAGAPLSLGAPAGALGSAARGSRPSDRDAVRSGNG